MIADDHDLAENFSPWVGGPMAHRAGGRLPGRYAPGPTAAPDRLQRRSHAAAGGPGGGGRLRDGGPALRRYGHHGGGCRTGFSGAIDNFQVLRALLFANVRGDLLPAERDRINPDIVWNIEKVHALWLARLSRRSGRAMPGSTMCIVRCPDRTQQCTARSSTAARQTRPVAGKR